MTSAKPPKIDRKTREARLAAALRDNLKRRKAEAGAKPAKKPPAD